MMMKHQSPAIAAGHLLLLLLLASTAPSSSQPSPPASDNTDNKTNNNNYGFSPNFNPSMAIIIVVLIAAFFFLGFFSIYIRQCGEADPAPTTVLGAAAARSRRKGIDPELLSTFPTLVYSEVKSLKIGKHALECAVCLSEFEDSDSLRLLPRCSHVFHPDCIDEWLTSHVTCPVCRSDLTDVTPAESAAADAAAHVIVTVEDRGSEEVKADMAELSRIASKRRRLPRSHSTGHSLNIEHAGDHDRFTLRLPEDVRKEIVAAGRMRRGESLRGVRVAGGEGSSRGRSIRLGRSGRWSSFKNLSVRVPAWAARRWEGEGSLRKGEESVKAGGEGSTRGRRVQFDCLGGGGGGGDSVKSAECRV